MRVRRVSTLTPKRKVHRLLFRSKRIPNLEPSNSDSICVVNFVYKPNCMLGIHFEIYHILTIFYIHKHYT